MQLKKTISSNLRIQPSPPHRREFLTITWQVATLACLFATATGCGDGRPKRVQVSGMITIDGEPLQHGSVLFAPESGRSAGGEIDSTGRFELTSYEVSDGVPPGKYRVAISGIESLGEFAQKWHAPKRYSQIKSSEISCEITEVTESLKFELTWDGGKPFIERF